MVWCGLFGCVVLCWIVVVWYGVLFDDVNDLMMYPLILHNIT